MFFWFFVVGALTVVMAGGVVRRPKPVIKAPLVVAEPDGEPMTEPIVFGEPVVDDQGPVIEAELIDAEVIDAELVPEPEPQPGPEPEPEPKPPAAPPRPVRPAPDLEDVEDLMFVDADIEADEPHPPRD